MLSIIICSVNPRFLSDIKSNLALVTGVEFELLIWDNREKNYGICKVYNLMAEKARFPILCFIHEDIIIKTEGWGEILVRIFSQPDSPGIAGIAGGKYKAGKLSGWYAGIEGMDFYHVLHKDGEKILDLSNVKSWSQNEEEVVCIDGVFMAVRKEIWEKYKFNETLLKGFHFYDLDFSLSVSKNFRAVVTKQIDIIHLTKGGDYGNKWVREAFVFHEYWNRQLPYYLKTSGNAELTVAKTWLERLQIEKISWANKLKWINFQKLYESRQLYWPIIKFLFYRPTGYHYAFSIAKKIKRKWFNG